MDRIVLLTRLYVYACIFLGRTAVRADVERVTAAAQCGPNVDVASTIANSTLVTLNSDGTFIVTVTDYYGGADGSRAVGSATVDTTSTGASFPVAASRYIDTEQLVRIGYRCRRFSTIVLELPSGTTCTGGSDGASCLVALATTANFGNCVQVQDSRHVLMNCTSRLSTA